MTPACPICGGSDFAEFSGRADAVCRGCGALERQRALVRTRAGELEAGRGRAALEVGPLSREVFGGFLRRRGWRYTAIDRWRTGNPRDPRAVGFVDAEADLSDLSRLFADDTFDLVVLQHVVEEIDDHRAALREVGRVLAPGGVALLEIPYAPGRPHSARQEPDRFGNVWRFGADLLDHVAEDVGPLEVVELAEGGYRGRLLVARPASSR